MGAVTKELAVKIGKVVLANIAGYLIWKGVKNKMNGKSVFGKEKKPELREQTYVDWNGNVVLGTEDFRVA